MAQEPVIQHWLVAVARAAELDGAAELDVASDADLQGTWDLVAMTCGCTQIALANAVAGHYGLTRADTSILPRYAHRLLPARVARKLKVVPLAVTDREIRVATADPVGLEAEMEIAHVSGRNVQFEVAPPAEIEQALEALYEESGPVHKLPPLEVEARGGPRVLVVDDEPGTRLLLKQILETGGYRVTEAEGGKEALAALDDEADPFALVTLDLSMPEMPGLQVLGEIRSRVATASLPVIVATGLGDREVEIELLEAGADDFVVKPVDPRRFLLRVEAVMRRGT